MRKCLAGLRTFLQEKVPVIYSFSQPCLSAGYTYIRKIHLNLYTLAPRVPFIHIYIYEYICYAR